MGAALGGAIMGTIALQTDKRSLQVFPSRVKAKVSGPGAGGRANYFILHLLV